MYRSRLLPFILVTGFLLHPEPVGAQTGRVLSRNPATGGAPEVRLEDLTPRFEPGALHDAFVAIEDDRAREAVPVLTDWLDENPGQSADGAVVRFGLATALVGLERWEEAAPVLEACVDDGGLFVDYCLFWSAQAALDGGDASRAEVLAATVAVDAVHGARAKFLRGRALLALGRADEAVEVLEAFLRDYPEAWYRNDVEFTLADALVADGQADEAARLLHRLATLNPDNSTETEANGRLEAIRDDLSEGARREVARRSTTETVDRAQVLFDRHRSEQVIEMLRPVVADLDAAVPDACRANYLIAKSYTKLRQHTDSLPYYEAILDVCHDEDLVVRALYNLGRAYWNVDRDQDGFDTFERLWVEFPHNSYADDAMLYGAQILRGLGRTAESSELLERQIVDFADGDMLADAVWALMADAYRAGDYRAAAQFADEVGNRTGETDLYTRGRVAYFHARSLEQLSLRTEAVAMYREVMRAHPMSFYSLLSLNRLQQLEPSAATGMIDELREASEASDGAIRLDPPEIRTNPFFVRGTELLRLGLYSMASDEFERLQDRYPNEVEVGWVVVLLYHRTGAHDLAHHVPGERTGLNLWYPNAENRERWEVAYPRPFLEEVERWAAERSIDPSMVHAIMREESGFNPRIESWANARGLLQLMLPTANDMAEAAGRGRVSASDLFDPDVNIELGTLYMRRLADLFDAHPSLVIAGYNGGQGNVRNWLRDRGTLPFDLWVEEIPYSQTRDYVKRVTMTLWVYHWLYRDDAPMVTLPFDLSGI